jgi:hypothetical protein
MGWPSGGRGDAVARVRALRLDCAPLRIRHEGRDQRMQAELRGAIRRDPEIAAGVPQVESDLGHRGDDFRVHLGSRGRARGHRPHLRRIGQQIERCRRHL